ncbi:MAG: DUF2786 domain-containing protein [Trebonia sp.]|jgi:hypothetical protein
MSKAGRQRRQRQEKERRRQRAAGSPGPGFGSPSAPRQVAPQQEQIASAIGEATQALCDDRQDAYDKRLEQLAIEQAAGWTQAVSRTLVEYLRGSVTSAWKRGWQPAELARQIGRELSAAHAAVVSDMITAEMLGYPAAAVDARWAAQVAVIEAAAPGNGAWWGSDAEYLSARYALGRDAEYIFTVANAVETLHAFHHLPALERLLPLPGTARPAAAARTGAGGTAAPADQRMLSRIRALLAKAESTEFAEEAEALSARAQELMAKYSIDHALLAAESGQAETPGGRRIAVDNPYEAPKATLLQTVAQANRCRVVWSKHIGLVTVIGFPADLDAVELLFTSLLVQANTAMLRAGGKQDAYGRSRTRAFRTSFLVSYAIRIGERLSEAAGQAEREAVAEQHAAAGGGTDLVPFLAARHQAVDDAMEEMFAAAKLTRSRAVRITDEEGWTSGRAAADLASLHNHAQVVG